MKRFLYIIGVAVSIFAVLVLGLIALGVVIYFEKDELMKNPIIASFFSNPEVQNIASNVAPALVPSIASSGAALTDTNNYKTENNYVAAKTAQEIAGMSWLIVHPNTPVPQLNITANVDQKKGHIHLEITGWGERPITSDFDAAYAWDNKAWAQFAHQLIGDGRMAEPANVSDNDPSDLLTPTGAVLAKKDVELSQLLQVNPASVTLHERAALLLLTLAFREDAAQLTDGRIAMSRACAHLAIARALAGGTDTTTTTGKIAHAANLALCGRELEAIPEISALVTPNPPLAIGTWVQTLFLITKCDWRMSSPDENSPLLLKIAWFKAVMSNLDDSLAVEHLGRLGKFDAVPDWGRAIWREPFYPSVGVGHRFCAATIALELQEIKTILAAEGDTITGKGPLSDTFKNPVGTTVSAPNGQNTVHVVGLDLFEDISERHCIAAVWETYQWMQNAWGVPDEASKLKSQMTQFFKDTRLSNWLLNYFDREQNGFAPVGTIHADLADLPPGFAVMLRWSEGAVDDMGKVKRYYNWPFPFGTVFEPDARGTLAYNVVAWHVDPNAPDFTQLEAICYDAYPLYDWNEYLSESHRSSGHDPTEDLKRFFDYNNHALHLYRKEMQRENKLTDAAAEEVLRKEVALNPDAYFDLGDLLAREGKDADAADAYRKGADKATNQVGFANDIQWLVKYDMDHDNQVEAEAMAKRAADVFSARGIDTYIWFLCRVNRYDEAENWAKQEQERYGGDEMSALYASHPDHYKTQFDAIVKKYYPDGFPKVSLADFSSPPKDGCLIRTSSPALAQAGLNVGEVIVALDSHPVHSEATYMFVRGMSDASEMDFIVWSHGQYLEVKASPPNRRFGNDIGDYRP